MDSRDTFTQLVEFDYIVSKSFSDYLFVGIDEAGRGALAGPVIACAFSWKKEIDYKNEPKNCPELFKLNDSKQLNKKARKKLYNILVKLGNYGLGYGSVLEIEKLNILNATFLAMKRAFDALLTKISSSSPISNLRSGISGPYVLIDGNKFNPYINSRQLPIVKGDAKSSLIASASIIGKVYRDSLMVKISKSKIFNRYAWRTNMGYGTLFHRASIKKHGTTPLHRKLFVQKTLLQNSLE